MMLTDLLLLAAAIISAVVNPWMPVSEIKDKARRRRMKLSDG